MHVITPRYDLQALRAQIPLLADTIPLNNCSQAPLTTVARAAANRFLDDWNRHGMDWDAWISEVERARRVFATLINADVDEIAVMSSVSHATSAVASALQFTPARNVVVASGAEFPTVGQVWLAQERRGASVRWVPVVDGAVPANGYAPAIDERTVIVSAAHAYYQNGAIQDIAAITQRAHEHGALCFVDAYQSLGVIPVDVKATTIDFLASGTLKYLMGTPGIAFLYVRRALIERLEPTVTGWFGRVNPYAFSATTLDWAATAARFDGGTPPLLPAYISRASIELLCALGIDAVHEYTQQLSRLLVQGAEQRGLVVHGRGLSAPKTPSTAIVCVDAHAVEAALRRRNIIVSARGPAIRLAPHGYNTPTEIEVALDALVDVINA